jgi:hypothetical protein
MVAAILRGRRQFGGGITGSVAALEDLGRHGEAMRVRARPMLDARLLGAHGGESGCGDPLQGQPQAQEQDEQTLHQITR